LTNTPSWRSIKGPEDAGSYLLWGVTSASRYHLGEMNFENLYQNKNNNNKGDNLMQLLLLVLYTTVITLVLTRLFTPFFRLFLPPFFSGCHRFYIDVVNKITKSGPYLYVANKLADRGWLFIRLEDCGQKDRRAFVSIGCKIEQEGVDYGIVGVCDIDYYPRNFADIH